MANLLKLIKSSWFLTLVMWIAGCVCGAIGSALLWSYTVGGEIATQHTLNSQNTKEHTAILDLKNEEHSKIDTTFATLNGKLDRVATKVDEIAGKVDILVNSNYRAVTAPKHAYTFTDTAATDKE